MKTLPLCFLAGAALLSSAALADTPPAETSTPDSARQAIKPSDFDRHGPASNASNSIKPVSITAKDAEKASPLGLTDTDETAPVQMPVYQVHDLPDHTVRELHESVAVRELLAPCTLFRKEVNHSQEVQAISAPIWPIAGEQDSHRLQARFPLLTLAW